MNILQVTDDVFRSDEPGTSDYQMLKDKFKTIIMFEGDEKEIAALLPVVVISQPISFWQMHMAWCAIPASRLEYIVNLVNGVPKPVLVHCKQGRDRTGLVIAAYRVKYCEWTDGAAWTEAKKLGYRSWLNFGLNRTWNDWLQEYEDIE